MSYVSNSQPADSSLLGIECNSQAKQFEKQARARASQALSNARQRCKNPNNPDYPNYGGKGVQMLFINVDQLLNAIGLPKDGHSLDRINPNGHYEPDNVRWTTLAVQAANKKSSVGNSHLAISTQVAFAKEALALQDGRKVAAVAWVRTLRAFNEGHLPQDQAEWMAQNFHCAGLLEANVDFDTVPDMANTRPGCIHLPALSLPNARVRIRYWPSFTMPAHSSVQEMGRLGGLETLAPEWNVDEKIWKLVQSKVEAGASGVALHGIPSQEDLLGGWIEGACLAMAAGIGQTLGVSSACYPMLRVHSKLAEMGSPECWSEDDHALLTVACLLIPDFSLDCGAWGRNAMAGWWRVEALLQHRHLSKLTTVVGVQNLGKLPPSTKNVVLGAYEHAEMPRTKPHSQEQMEFCAETFGIPVGSVALRGIKNDALLKKLAVHDGWIGT